MTSAYGSVNNIASEEDEALGRCKAAIVHIDSLVKDAADINSGEPIFICSMCRYEIIFYLHA